MLIRSKSAPPRPLTDIEEFRKSDIYEIIENAISYSSNIINNNELNFDIESTNGQNNCKNFLKCIQKLQNILKTNTSCRKYRNNFSKAYQILYKKDSLCYLTEILDSAHEAVPSLYVNGQKFDFSNEVIDTGKLLFKSFIKIQKTLKECYQDSNYENNYNSVNSLKKKLINSLEIFDSKWVIYEEIYIRELMKIEEQARKYITDAIKIEKWLQIEEDLEKNQGKVIYSSEKYLEIRKKMVDQFAIINSVANYEGHGRDDLGVEILSESEITLRKISPSQSISIRNLSENIKKSFLELRILIRKYENNIEVVDPQLRNNSDWVDALTYYEKYWEKGKEYLLNKKNFTQLINFSNLLEGLSEKYKDFLEMKENIDTNLFVIIPMLLIYKSYEKDDFEIVELFLPSIKNTSHKNYELYSNLKEILFFINTDFLKNENTSNIFNNKKKNMMNNNFKYSIEKKGYKTLLKNQKNLKEKLNNKLSHIIYNLFEKLIIGVVLSENEKKIQNKYLEKIDQFINKLKILSMELQRYNPLEWNSFLDVALDNSDFN